MLHFQRRLMVINGYKVCLLKAPPIEGRYNDSEKFITTSVLVIQLTTCPYKHQPKQRQTRSPRNVLSKDLSSNTQFTVLEIYIQSS